jgi:hypothetical protein
VGGIDLDVVRKSEEFVVERREEVVRRAFATEIRAPDIANKERVAGKDHPRLFRPRIVRDKITHAFGCVARRMQCANDDIPERDLGAIVQRSERVLQVCAAMIVDRRVRSCRELTLPGAMICVNVGAENSLDPHPAFASNFDVLSDLELRIDDRRAALTPSTEDVRRATCFRSEYLTEDHDGAP